MKELDPLFFPKSIALIGASPHEEKLGGIALRNLLRTKKNVYPVNPKYEDVLGTRCYPSIREIPEAVDLSIIMRPAVEVPGILAEHAGKARFVLIVSAGFAEVGNNALQKEIVRIGRELKLRLIGPNCLGIFNPHHRLDTLFLPPENLKRPRRGNVAVVSQSGAVMMCILDAVRMANTGVSKAINYGNAVDLDAAEIFEYLAVDDSTEVVVSYLESVADGRRFLEAARFLSARKPLLILKAGKGAGGRAAAFSHTGRLAGDYRVFHSLMKQSGLREALDFDDLLDAAKAVSYQRPSHGNRVCIITNGGGSGVLAADECARLGLEMPELPTDIRNGLREIFPSFYTVANPVDLTGQARIEDYRQTLQAVGDHYDSFLVIALTGVPGITLGLGEYLRNFRESVGKPLVVHIAQGGVAPRLIRLLERAGIPVYRSPERAMRGLAALLDTRGGRHG
ncbi:MAG: CoA-binding protein [Deltaproteobacteria bacterium]|nr:CoA-binding protein [Deltaproteobacteria bacterium]TLN04068.1 MAG: CoA-binding protein [bacterium]